MVAQQPVTEGSRHAMTGLCRLADGNELRTIVRSDSQQLGRDVAVGVHEGE